MTKKKSTSIQILFSFVRDVLISRNYYLKKKWKRFFVIIWGEKYYWNIEKKKTKIFTYNKTICNTLHVYI